MIHVKWVEAKEVMSADLDHLSIKMKCEVKGLG
jgi:hypothetical protein